MSGRRGILRALATLPAALKPAAEALSATAAQSSFVSGSPLDQSPPVNKVAGWADDIAHKAARIGLAKLERRDDRRRTGQLTGIDLDLWAVRSYSPVYRAMKQSDRREEGQRETSPFRRVMGWLSPYDEI